MCTIILNIFRTLTSAFPLFLWIIIKLCCYVATSTSHRKRENMGTMDLHLNHVCCYNDLILAVNPDKQPVFLLLWRGKTTDKKTCRYYCCLIMVRWHIWGSSNTCLFDGKFSYSPAGLLLLESHSWRACFLPRLGR